MFREGDKKMKKKVFVVEFRGESQKYSFDSLQKAKDYALVVAGFGGKQYRISKEFVAVGSNK
jgi:hypothetical protein